MWVVQCPRIRLLDAYRHLVFSVANDLTIGRSQPTHSNSNSSMRPTTMPSHLVLE